MDNSNNEQALIRVLRAIIHAEINERIDQITESQAFKIEDHEHEINDLIREYISYNVTVTLDC